MSRRERREQARRDKVDWSTVAQRPEPRYEKAAEAGSLSGKAAQQAAGILIEAAPKVGKSYLKETDGSEATD